MINIISKNLFWIALASLVVALSIVNLAWGWTNPAAAPPSGGGVLYYSGGNFGIGTTTPSAALDVGGIIKASGGLIIETRTSDPVAPATGRIWLRTDI